jgi:hypothetical protein
MIKLRYYIFICRLQHFNLNNLLFLLNYNNRLYEMYQNILLQELANSAKFELSNFRKYL